MDLVSITAAAIAIGGLCIKVSAVVSSRVSNFRNSDKTVRDFTSEINLLRNVLDVIVQADADARLEQHGEQREMIRDSLRDCRTYVGEIDSVLEGIRSRSGIGRVVATLRSDPIKGLRKRVRRLMGTLQLCMSTITVELGFSTAHTIAEIPPQLGEQRAFIISNTNAVDDLSAQLNTLNDLIRAELPHLSRSRRQSSEADERISRRFERSIRLAQAASCRASSVIGDSHSTSHGGDPRSDFGSVRGWLPEETRTRIEDWIPASNIEEETVEASSDESTVSAESKVIFTMNVASDATGPSESDSPESSRGPTANDSEEYLQDEELFQACIRTADGHHCRKDFKNASKFYAEAVKRSRSLEGRTNLTHFRDRVDSFLNNFIEEGDYQMKIGVLTAATEYFEEALAFLRELYSRWPSQAYSQKRRHIHVQKGIAYYQRRDWGKASQFLALEAKTDAIDILALEAHHYLALVYLQTRRLALAEQHVKLAANGRRRQLGGANAEWHESAALRVAIYKAKHDVVQSDIYASQVPPGYRSRFARDLERPKRALEFENLCMIFATLKRHPSTTSYSSTSSAPYPSAPIRSTDRSSNYYRDLDSYDSAYHSMESLAPSPKLVEASKKLLKHLKDHHTEDLKGYPYFKEIFWRDIETDIGRTVGIRSHTRAPKSATKSTPKCFTLLHLFALLGLDSEAQIWVSKFSPDEDVCDQDKQTPVTIAIQHGQAPFVRAYLLARSKNPKNIAKMIELAIHGPSLEVLKLLISRPDVGALYSAANNGDTILMSVVRLSNPSALEYLLKQEGVNVNERNAAGATALSIAAASGDVSTLEILTKAPGIDFRARTGKGNSVLYLAAKCRHEEPMRLLLERGDFDSNDKGAALLAAGEAGHTLVVRRLLHWDITDKYIQDALLAAVEQGHENVVDVLLKLKNVNTVNNRGESLLIIATRNNHIDIARRLSRTGADVNFLPLRPGKSDRTTSARHGTNSATNFWLGNIIEAPSVTQDTAKEALPALHTSVQYGHRAILQLLLENRVTDVNLKDAHGRTALHHAVGKSNVSMIERLLGSPGILPDSKAISCGKTALHMAVDGEKLKVVDALLAHPTLDPNVPDKRYYTPLMTAASRDNQDSRNILRVLCLHDKIDGNYHHPRTRTTALHIAAQNRIEEDVTSLLLHNTKVKPRAKNIDGLTPADLARQGSRGWLPINKRKKRIVGVLNGYM